MPFLQAAGRRIEYERLDGPADRPVMVFLHEGLGSAGMWRDFPARCAAASGCGGLVYSRYGYGRSEELHEPRRADYMHTEAFESLPDLLSQAGVTNPILFGHSDGASIALLHAARFPVRGVVALAPHVFVEPEAITGVAEALHAWRTTAMREKLARFHDHVDTAFSGWHDIWTAPEFRSWSIEECLPEITCPILAIQGEQDEYGTMAQLDRLTARAPQTRQLRLNLCEHSPHRDQPDAVIEATRQFAGALDYSARGA